MSAARPRPGRTPLDWGAAHRRIEAAAQALRELDHPPPEKAQALLRERADRLAQEPPVPPAAAGALELLTFRLGPERYALETRFVLEVARLSDLTPVPSTPAFLMGVTHHRGEILAILDLRRLLGVEGKGLTDLTRNLVVGVDAPEFGILAEEVAGVLRVGPGGLAELPGEVTVRERAWICGAAPGDWIVLDAAKMLADDRLIIDQREEGP